MQKVKSDLKGDPPPSCVNVEASSKIMFTWEPTDIICDFKRVTVRIVHYLAWSTNKKSWEIAV